MSNDYKVVAVSRHWSYPLVLVVACWLIELNIFHELKVKFERIYLFISKLKRRMAWMRSIFVTCGTLSRWLARYSFFKIPLPWNLAYYIGFLKQGSLSTEPLSQEKQNTERSYSWRTKRFIVSLKNGFSEKKKKLRKRRFVVFHRSSSSDDVTKLSRTTRSFPDSKRHHYSTTFM